MAWAFNPFTGFLDKTGSSGGGSADGFLPYNYIDTGVSVTVPLHRQMAIHEEFTVLGELYLLGNLTLVDENNIFRELVLNADVPPP